MTKKSGYENLLVYRLAVTIFDLADIFCKRFLSEVRFRRTVEQMEQAARSGKHPEVEQSSLQGSPVPSFALVLGQNIVEGSLEKSTEGNIKLTGVARASYGELLEDFKDFLRKRGLPPWEKDDSRVLRIRAYKEDVKKPTNLTNLSNWTNLDFNNPDNFANLMICLIYKQSYLLDQLLRSQQEKFVKEGGFRENLFRKRREFLKSNLTN